MNGYLFDKEAYDLILKCTESSNFSEWDKWRENKSQIYLEGANFENLDLRNINLSSANLSHSKFNNSKLHKANFHRSLLANSEMKNTKLVQANLRDASIDGAKLQSSDLTRAQLQGVNAQYTHLEKANLHNAHLENADFSNAVVDGETLISTVNIDRNTMFLSVGLSSARVRPGLLEALNSNIRRYRWQEWYDDSNIFRKAMRKFLISPFWFISDYGSSTERIVCIFVLLAVFFAGLYSYNPGSIKSVECTEFPSALRILSFSFSTMITLGFGDMNAAPNSLLGNIAVTLQVISGYIILAALVSRIAILFNSGGPATKYKKNYKKFSP